MESSKSRDLYTLTAVGCGKCKALKTALINNNIPFQDIDARTEYGTQIMDELNTDKFGLLLDKVDGKFNIVSLKDILSEYR